MQKKDSVWNPIFVSVFIANFCQQMGQQMMNTLVPKFARELGASASVVGFVASVFAIIALAMRPVSSPAIDAFSKKKLLMIAQFLVFVAFIGYGLSHSVPAMVAARVIHGIGSGVCPPLLLALASNSLPDDKLGTGIGYFSLGQAVAQAVGPSVGLSLANSIGYNKTFFIGAAVLGLAVCLSFMIKEDPNEVRPPYRIRLNTIICKAAVRPGVLVMCLGMAFSCIGSFLAIYAATCGIPNIGLYFTFYACTMLITRPLCGKLNDKYGFDKVLVPGIIFFALSFLTISFARTLPMFLLAGVIGAFGYGVCQPTGQSLSMRVALRHERGAAGSTNYIFMDTGALIGPNLAGMIAERLTASTGSETLAYAWTFRAMIIPMLIGLVWIITQTPRIKRDIEARDEMEALMAAAKADDGDLD